MKRRETQRTTESEIKHVRKATKITKGSIRGTESRSSIMTFSERPSVASIATVPETAASQMMSIPREKLASHNLEKKSNVTS